MTSFDFDVISDKPAPRVMQPAAIPQAKAPPSKEPDAAPHEEPMPCSDAA